MQFVSLHENLVDTQRKTGLRELLIQPQHTVLVRNMEAVVNTNSVDHYWNTREGKKNGLPACSLTSSFNGELRGGCNITDPEQFVLHVMGEKE